MDIDTLRLQIEEVEEVRWFDVGEVLEGCKHRDGRFCVPMDGLLTLIGYLESEK